MRLSSTRLSRQNERPRAALRTKTKGKILGKKSVTKRLPRRKGGSILFVLFDSDAQTHSGAYVVTVKGYAVFLLLWGTCCESIASYDACELVLTFALISIAEKKSQAYFMVVYQYSFSCVGATAVLTGSYRM